MKNEQRHILFSRCSRTGIKIPAIFLAMPLMDKIDLPGPDESHAQLSWQSFFRAVSGRQGLTPLSAIPAVDPGQPALHENVNLIKWKNISVLLKQVCARQRFVLVEIHVGCFYN